MSFHLREMEQVFHEVDARPQGLSMEEAKSRLERMGPNRLEEKPKTPLIVRFLRQLADPMVLILLAAALVSGITALIAGEPLWDVGIILFVVVINAVLGVYQESKAEAAIQALRDMMSPLCRVVREGKLMEIPTEDLVVGDVIALEAGDAVPADARIIESASLQMEEAALTGESLPIHKAVEALTGESIALGDRINMAYLGGTVVYGRGRAVVTATGMNTEMGRIATALSQAVEQETPLQRKLARLSRTLSIAVLGICAFIFAFALLRAGSLSGEVVLHTFLVAVSLAVAAIPEGLSAVVTIVLSIGVTRMSKRNAIIRKLTAVETLGCVQVICSDKTGTLTQNLMTVTTAWGGHEGLLARGMALCTDAQWDGESALGEPTECALVTYAAKMNLPKGVLEAEAPRIGEVPFDSQRKRMTTLHREEEGIIQFTKGAPDEVIARCDTIILSGKAQPMTDDLRREALAKNGELAGQALRVLALAIRRHEAMPEVLSADGLEQGMTLVGLLGMKDPVRPEVKDAIADCRRAGIRPIMITGDHRETAMAIARELGILQEEREAITGAALSQMDDEAFFAHIEDYAVYARVQPEHKVRIVKAWQQRGKVVAMTGDGVNDAPSIKGADIGVGMGITGTDVTKNVADMVLADDNFTTIVRAVEEGRRIYDNIQKAVQFLLASNLSEVLAIFVATLLGFTILEPIHILWVNLITDTFPALALGMEPGEKDLMTRSPRDEKESLFSGGVGGSIVYQGVLVAILTLAAYFLGHYVESGRFEIASSADGVTMAFLTLSMAEIFHSFNMRSLHGSLFTVKGHNPYLFLAMGGSLLLTTGVLYIPFLQNAFGFAPISLLEYAMSIGLALLMIPAVEGVKALLRRRHR